MAGDCAPLVLTLELDRVSFAWLERLRQTHFPPDRNQVPAHVSLFHSLPGHQLALIRDQLQEACGARGPIPIRVAGLRNLGQGVAFTLESPELMSLHRSLASTHWAWLTKQDRQPYRPHITIQNKVSRERAAELHASLGSSFSPRSITGTGLLLWHYRGGPWELALTCSFRPGSLT